MGPVQSAGRLYVAIAMIAAVGFAAVNTFTSRLTTNGYLAADAQYGVGTPTFAGSTQHGLRQAFLPAGTISTGSSR